MSTLLSHWRSVTKRLLGLVSVLETACESGCAVGATEFHQIPLRHMCQEVHLCVVTLVTSCLSGRGQDVGISVLAAAHGFSIHFVGLCIVFVVHDVNSYQYILILVGHELESFALII